MISKRFDVLMVPSSDQHPDGAWLASTHCDCGSTFACGEPWPTPNDAVFSAMSGLRVHLASSVNNACGTREQNSTPCRCDQCKAHDRELAELLAGKKEKR